MDNSSEAKQRNRRRKRAQRMQAIREKQDNNNKDDSGEEDESNSGTKEKPQRPPCRRRKAKEPLVEEDIIDGFAILAFKTYEDLEVSGPLCVCDGARRCRIYNNVGCWWCFFRLRQTAAVIRAKTPRCACAIVLIRQLPT